KLDYSNCFRAKRDIGLVALIQRGF
ncbi:hypothetical protein NPIL_529601, partial [Nephila pilipes]